MSIDRSLHHIEEDRESVGDIQDNNAGFIVLTHLHLKFLFEGHTRTLTDADKQNRRNEPLEKGT